MRTRVADEAAVRPQDLVTWEFQVTRSDQLWLPLYPEERPCKRPSTEQVL